MMDEVQNSRPKRAEQTPMANFSEKLAGLGSKQEGVQNTAVYKKQS